MILAMLTFTIEDFFKKATQVVPLGEILIYAGLFVFSSL